MIGGIFSFLGGLFRFLDALTRARERRQAFRAGEMSARLDDAEETAELAGEANEVREDVRGLPESELDRRLRATRKQR